MSQPIKKIICLGDSITDNRFTPTYVNHWQKLIATQSPKPTAWQIIGAGIGGQTASEALARIKTDVIAPQPQLVTILFGHNEVLNQQSTASFRLALTQIITQIKDQTAAQIWLLTPNQIGDAQYLHLYPPFLTVISELANQFQLPLIDFWHQAFNGYPLTQIYDQIFEYQDTWLTDYLHPNQFGHQLLAKMLFEHWQKQFAA